MSIPKEDIQIEKISEFLKNLNDDCTFYDAIYNPIIGITKGIDDIRNGRGSTLEEFNKEREELYSML